MTWFAVGFAMLFFGIRRQNGQIFQGRSAVGLVGLMFVLISISVAVLTGMAAVLDYPPPPWPVLAVGYVGMGLTVSYLRWVKRAFGSNKVLWFAPMGLLLLVGIMLIVIAVGRFQPSLATLAEALGGGIVLVVFAAPLIMRERKNPLNVRRTDTPDASIPGSSR